MAWRGKDKYFDPDKRAGDAATRALAAIAVEEAEQARRGMNAKTRRLSGDRLKTFEVTVEAIVMNLLAYGLSPWGAGGVAVTRSVCKLGAFDPLKSEAVNSGLPKRLDELEAAGWLQQLKGARTPTGKASLTVLRPGPRFIEVAAETKATLEGITQDRSRPAIVVRDEEKRLISGRAYWQLVETTEGRRIASDLHRINESISEANIQLLDGTRLVSAHPREQHRSFLSGSLELGGRFSGGFWYQMSSEDRFRLLRIDGEPIVQLDYNAMMIRSAYGLAGVRVRMPDPYQLPDHPEWPRDGVKLLINTMFWDDPASGERDRMPKGARQFFPEAATFLDVKEAILEAHGPVAGMLTGYYGPRLQFVESEVINRAVLMAAEQEITVLPVHDALLCPLSVHREVHRIMERAFTDICGGEAIIEVEMRLGG